MKKLPANPTEKHWQMWLEIVGALCTFMLMHY